MEHHPQLIRYNTSKARHDRAFSLEFGQDNLNFMNNSIRNQNATSKAKINNNLFLISPKIGPSTTKNYSDNNILRLNSTKNSPDHVGIIKICKTTLVSNVAMQTRSNQNQNQLQASTSSLRSKSRNSHNHVQSVDHGANLSREDKSIINAIKAEVDMEFIKEKELLENKSIIKSEIDQDHIQIDDLKAKLKNYKEFISSKQIGIIYRIQDIGKMLNDKNESNESPSVSSFSSSSLALAQELYNSNESNGNQGASGDQTDNILRSMITKQNKSGGDIPEIVPTTTLLDNYSQEIERKELIKNLQKVNMNLHHDLKLLELLMVDEASKTAIGSVMYDFKSITRSNEDYLQALNHEKALLLHKIYQCEDKFAQYQEIKNMIREDFYSHIELITECVVIHEELENYIECMNLKYPEYFENIMKDIELTELLTKLQLEIKRDENRYNELITGINLLSKELNILTNKTNELMCNMDRLKHMENISKHEIIAYEKSIYIMFKDNYIVAGQLISPNDSLINLLKFLRIFGISNEVDRVELEKYLDTIIDYQFKLIIEIITLIQTSQDSVNLEGSNIQNDGENGIVGNSSNKTQISSRTIELDAQSKSIPFVNEVLGKSNNKPNSISNLPRDINTKQIKLMELSTYFMTNRRIIAENLRRDNCSNSRVFNIIEENSSLNLYEILKILQNPKIENILYSIVSSKKQLYENINNISLDISHKASELNNLNNQIKQQQSAYNEKAHELYILSKNLENRKQSYIESKNILEGIQANCKNAILKENEKVYQNYIAAQSKYLKKIQFQFGKNYVTKVQKSMINDLSTANNSNVSKIRNEIYEIKRTLSRIDNIRNSNTFKIENDIKKNFNQVNDLMKEEEFKLEKLNHELIDIFDNEKKINEDLGQNYNQQQQYKGNSLMSTDQLVGKCDSSNTGLIPQIMCNNKYDNNNSTNGNNNMSDIVMNVQTYKNNISQSLCSIIDKVMMLKNAANGQIKLNAIKRSEIEAIVKKLQAELSTLNEIDFKNLDQYEKDLKAKEDALKNKQARIMLLDKEIKMLKAYSESHNNEIKERILNDIDKDATNEISSKNIIPSSSSDIVNFKEKSIPTRKTVNKFIKESPKYGKVTLDIRQKKELYLNIGDLNKTEKEHSINNQNCNIEQTLSNKYNPQLQVTANFISPIGSTSNSVFSAKSIQEISERSSIQNSDLRISKTPLRTSVLTENKPIPGSTIKFLSISDRIQLEAMIKDFEAGFSIYKKFSSNTTIAMKNEDLTNMDQVLKSYGKRKIKLSKETKSIDILKVNLPLARYVNEYTYDWKALKKVFIPPKTIDTLRSYMLNACGGGPKNPNKGIKNQQGKYILKENHEENILHPFALDVENKGRIELLTNELKMIICLYNVINLIIDSNGNSILQQA